MYGDRDMETFPRKPVLDRIIVREIPIAEYYEQPKEGEVGYVPLGGGEIGASSFKEKSDRGVVVAVSDKVDDVHVGDTVFFDEFAMCDPVFLNPAHKNRSDLPIYWQMRVADLKGVQNPEAAVEAWEAERRACKIQKEAWEAEQMLTHA
jgi:co-chaperonin GroES (HSP10)